MKPLNLDNRPCSPISSNCVIWQGPDIPCIKLCTGDTVSDIIFKLGTELCTIMDQLDVSNYDLSCFNLTVCPPEDFQALIQLLINKICEANGVPTDVPKLESGCPDCVINVAPCFIEGTTTNMQLIDYVIAIGNRICSIISEIGSINNSIDNINVTLEDLQIQINNLPAFTLPPVNVNCLLTPGPYSLQIALNALYNNINGYCNLLAATGNPAAIVTAVESQCVVDGDLTLSDPTKTFAQLYLGTWVPMALTGTVADAINNIWIVLCDMYSYLNNPLTVGNTSSVTLDFTSNVLTARVNDTGWVNLNGFDFYTGTLAKPQCRRIGNVIHFRGLAYIPLDNGSGSVVNLTADNSYRTTYQVTPFTGSGGITYDTGNRIVFNNDTSVIPASVLDLGTTLDSTYRSTSTLAVREIQVVDGGNTSNGYLSAAVLFFIDVNKKLKLIALDTLELNPGDTSAEIGMSALRYITSNVVTGNYLPNYLNAASELHSFTTSPAPAAPDRTITSEASANYQWPVTCNAGNRTQVGGFKVALDGLMAYVDPCTLDVKNNECKPA